MVQEWDLPRPLYAVMYKGISAAVAGADTYLGTVIVEYLVKEGIPVRALVPINSSAQV